MSLSDVFKDSFLEGFASNNIDIKFVAVALLLSLIISTYIFFAYRLMTRKAFYNKSFNITLVGVALITTAIVITIQSSIVVSLGMVGALSIVRFRTAVKDPMDLMFLFWSISVGIICGAGYAVYAVLLSVFCTIAMFLLDKIPVLKAPMILVINADHKVSEDKITEQVNKYASYLAVKSRNVTSTSKDYTIELRTDKGGELVDVLMGIDGIYSASLIAHDGEVTF